jgi:hypothetical protein
MTIMKRENFKYSMRYILESIMRCFCLRNLSTVRKDPRANKHFKFDKAKTKLNNELDAVKILKSLRQLKLLT